MNTQLSEGALLDFDGWLGQQDEATREGIDTHLSVVEESRRPAEKAKLASMFAVSEATGLDIQEVNREWEVVRGGFAEQQGEDWLATKDDDAKFHGKLVEGATKRKDERVLILGPDDPKDTQAQQESLVFKSQEAAYAGKPYADALSDWETSHSHRPGYDPTRASQYATIAAETHKAVSESLTKVRPLADQALAEIVNFRKHDGGTMAPFALLRGLSAEEKNIAFRLMTEGAKPKEGRGIPMEEKGRDQAFLEAVGRGFENLIVGGGSAKVRSKLLATKFRAGDMVTGKTAEAEVMADLRSQSGAMDSAGDMPRPGGRALTSEEAKQWNQDLAGALEDLDTAEQLRKFGQQVADPAKAGGVLFQKLVLPIADSAAIMTSLAVPGGWAMALTLGADSYRGDEYAKNRALGMDPQEADALAGITGTAQAALDKLQLGILAKGIPNVTRALERFAMSGSTAARVAGNVAGTLAAETGIELTQDFIIPAIVQDNLRSDPTFDVQWENVWRDVAKAAPDVALGMVLLSGMGGVAQTAQQNTFIREFSGSPSAMRARGYSVEQIEEIQNAPGDQKGALLAQYLPAEAPRGGDQKALVADAVKFSREEQSTFDDLGNAELVLTKEAAQIGVRVVKKGSDWQVTTPEGKVLTVDNVEAARVIREDLKQASSQQEAEALVSIIDSWHSKAGDTQRETTLTGETVRTDGETITGTRDGEIVREITDAATLETIREEARMDAQDKAIDGLVNGSNTIEFAESVGNAAKQTIQRIELNQSESVALTAIHEQLESTLRIGLEKGSITRNGIVSAIRGIESALAPANARTKEERAFRERVLRVADGSASETELRETVVELAVADIIGRRKDGQVMPAGSVTAALNAQLTNAGDAKTLKGVLKFRAFLKAVRAWFRAVFGTVAALRKAKREGKGKDFEALVNKLLGLDEAQLESDTATEVETLATDIGIPISTPTASVSAGNRVELVMKRLDSALAKDPEKRRVLANEAARRLDDLAFRFDFGVSAATAKDDSPKAKLVRDLQTFNALLSVLPPEIRGKVGGFVTLAQLGDRGRMTEIGKRIEKLSELLEKHLKEETTAELQALLEKAQPDREGGKASRGKLGAAVHRYFDQVAAAFVLSDVEVDSQRAAIEAARVVPGVTPEQLLDLFEREQILDTFGAWSDKSAADMDAAFRAAQDVYRDGRNKRRVVEENRLNEVRDLADEVIKTLGGPSYASSQAQKLKSTLAKASLDLKSFAEVLDAMLGRDHPLTKRWSRAAREGFAQKNDTVRALNRRWEEALKTATGKNRLQSRRALWGMGQKQTITVDTAGAASSSTQDIPVALIDKWEAGTADPAALGISPAEADQLKTDRAAMGPKDKRNLLPLVRVSRASGEVVKMTEAEGVFITMLGAQEQYADALDRAGWSDAAIKEVEKQLSPSAVRLRQFLREEYRDGYTPLAAIFERMFGVELPQVKNYAPAAFYHEGAELAKDPTASGTLEGGMRAGFLKNRKKHSAAPKLENAFATFFGHVNQTAHWKGLAEFVREFSSVMGKPDVKRAIEAAHGTEMLGAISQWTKAIEGNGLQVQSGILDKAVTWLTGQQAKIALAWKLGTIMKQSTAILGAAYHIPVADYARGFGKLMSGQLEFREMFNSPVIQRRLETGFAPEVRTALNDLWSAKPNMRGEFVEKGMELLGFVDAFFTTGSAAIAFEYHFEQAKKAGMNETAAREVAMREVEEIVARTAQPADVVNRSLMELRMGAFGKLAFLFASEARQKSSMWMTAWGRTLTGKATSQDYKVLAISHFIVGPMIQVITSAWRDAQDDDDDSLFEMEHWSPLDFLKAVIAGPLSGIPLVGSALSGFRDDGIFGRAKKAIASAGQLIEGPKENEAEAVEWYFDRITRVMQGLDAFTGVVGGIASQALNVADNFLPDTEDEAEKKDRARARQE
jgi:hypothetical protein